MRDQPKPQETGTDRRAVLKTAGAATFAGWAVTVAVASTATAQEPPPIDAATARACLLLPASGDERNKAVSLADLATRAARQNTGVLYPYYQFAKGLAEYRQEHFERAITITRGDASSCRARYRNSYSAWPCIGPGRKRRPVGHSPRRCSITSGVRIR